MAKEPASGYLTSSDVAKVLGISPHGVRVARRRGKLHPAIETDSGVYIFERAEVERFRAKREERLRLLRQAAE